MFSLAGLVLAATLFKPSFAIGFSFAVLCVLIYDFVRSPKKRFLNCVLLGTTVLPGGFLILYQQSLALNQDGGVGIGLFKAFYAGSNYPITGLLVSIAFPLVCLIYVYKDLVKDRYYAFAWLLWGVNFVIASLLYETGEKMKHGNFVWGFCFAIGLLFVVSVYKYLVIIREKKTDKCIVLSMVLGMHLFAWFKYFFEVLTGGYPW